LDSKLASLRSAAKSLGKSNDLVSYKATPANADLLNATSSTGSVAGTYKVTILNRSTRSMLNGTTDAGLALDASKTLNDAASLGTAFLAGVFTINGTQVSVATSDTLDSLVTKINGAVAGVTAAYDSGTDKFTLS